MAWRRAGSIVGAPGPYLERALPVAFLMIDVPQAVMYATTPPSARRVVQVVASAALVPATVAAWRAWPRRVRWPLDAVWVGLRVVMQAWQ